MQVKYLGETFTIRRTASGEVVSEWHNPKPIKRPAPSARVSLPRSYEFEFEGESYSLWRDPLEGFRFERARPTAKVTKPLPVAREAKPKSVAVNITSIVADRHALPQRTGVKRRVEFNEPTSVPRAESVIIRGRSYWAWEAGGKLHVERQRATGGKKV